MRVALPLLILLPVLALGCNPATSLVENAIEAELPALLGPAEQYTATVDGLQLSSNSAERVTIVGTRVQPADSPVLDRLVLVLDDIRYDANSKRLDSVSSATASAQILATDLVDFLDTQDGIREASLSFLNPDGATLRFRPNLRGIVVPGGVAPTLTGRLVANDGRIDFVVSEVRAGGLNLGRTVARRLSDAINPILDLTEAELALEITAVRVQDGVLHLEATGDPTALHR